MTKLITGEDSTLGTYLKVAKIFGPKAEAFIKKKIAESPNGDKEEVIAAESQMLMLLALIDKDKEFQEKEPIA